MNMPGSETRQLGLAARARRADRRLAARLRAATRAGRSRVILEALAAALICLDPGHGTVAVGRRAARADRAGLAHAEDQGSRRRGRARRRSRSRSRAGRARSSLARGFRVAMTRERAGYTGGNVERAEVLQCADAALMLRIHADGSTDRSQRGVHTLYPALRRGWTDDVYAKSLRAAAPSEGGRAGDGCTRSRASAPQRPDRLQLGRRPGRARRDRVPLQPAPRPGSFHSAAYRARIARGLAAGAAQPWHIGQNGANLRSVLAGR